MFRDEFPDLGHEVTRDIHDGLGGFNAGLVFLHRVILGLSIVVGQHALRAALIPSVWKLNLTMLFLILALKGPAVGGAILADIAKRKKLQDGVHVIAPPCRRSPKI